MVIALNDRLKKVYQLSLVLVSKVGTDQIWPRVVHRTVQDKLFSILFSVQPLDLPRGMRVGRYERQGTHIRL